MSEADVFSLARRFIRQSLEDGAGDTQYDHALLADKLGVEPKVLRANPSLHRVIQELVDRPNAERVLDWTIRDWLEYHHIYIEQGYRYGMPELQQTWMGRPIVKTPFDCWMYQEILHRVRPDLVVEFGVKFGGSILYYANLLDLIGHGEVIGVDVDVSEVNDLDHPRVTIVEGSSVDTEIVGEIHRRAANKRVIVIADSDHEKSHVLAELDAYHDLVGVGSYFVVEDSISDLMGWVPVPAPGAHPAIKEFLASHPEFESDRQWAERYLITSNPDGYLLRVSE